MIKNSDIFYSRLECSIIHFNCKIPIGMIEIKVNRHLTNNLYTSYLAPIVTKSHKSPLNLSISHSSPLKPPSHIRKISVSFPIIEQRFSPFENLVGSPTPLRGTPDSLDPIVPFVPVPTCALPGVELWNNEFWIVLIVV